MKTLVLWINAITFEWDNAPILHRELTKEEMLEICNYNKQYHITLWTENT